MTAFIPALAVISAITQEINSQVTTEDPHGFSVGAFIRLNIPKSFGMQQATGTQVEILTVPTDTTFTTNLNTTTFDAFSVPVSPKQAALAIPIGEFGTYLSSTKTNVLGRQPNGLIPPLA